MSTGSQFVWNYGDRSNGELLCSYGFVLEELNDHLSVTNLNVGTLRGGYRCEPLSMDASSEAAKKCLSNVLQHFSGFAGTQKAKALAVLKEFQTAAENRSNELGPETVEQDEERLAADKVNQLFSTNYRNALVVRLGEKKVAEW